jgi:hypothetical protein
MSFYSKKMHSNYCKGNYTFIHTNVFLFQLAKGRIEREIYIKLIAPFIHDLPTSEPEGLRKVCTEHKYAYFGRNLLNTKISLSIPCKVIPLPGNSYRIQWAFIISKNSPYKGLINWR